MMQLTPEVTVALREAITLFRAFLNYRGLGIREVESSNQMMEPCCYYNSERFGAVVQRWPCSHKSLLPMRPFLCSLSSGSLNSAASLTSHRGTRLPNNFPYDKSTSSSALSR